MDITVDIKNYKLNIRACAVIIHDSKILVHKNINSDHYALIGGRVKIGENSENTVKREIFEELGKEIVVEHYIATIENFFEMKGCKYHEILFIYKAEFVDDEDKNIIKTIQNVEGKDYLHYDWIQLDEIDKYTVLPAVIKKVIKEEKFPIHKINYDIK